MPIFNLTKEQFISLQNDGISLDFLYIAECIKNGENFVNEGNISHILQGMGRKGILSNGNVNEQYSSLLVSLRGGKIKKVKKPDWNIQALGDLYEKLQQKLIELTGKSQITIPFKPGDKKKFSFLCNKIDLENRIIKAIDKYQLTDFSEIEATLIRYIEKCHKSGFWFPLLEYYILKRGEDGIERSRMVTEMGIKEEENEIEETNKAGDIFL